MENVKREQFKLILSSICASLIIVFLSFMIGYKLFESLNRRVYLRNNLLIDIEPNINYKISKYGESLKGNRVLVTNNDTNSTSFSVVMCSLSNDEDDIMVSLDDNLIRSLKKFKKKDNCYILYDYTLESGYTFITNIKLFTNSDNVYNSKFKLDIVEGV